MGLFEVRFEFGVKIGWVFVGNREPAIKPIPAVRLRRSSSFIFPTAYSGRKQTATGRRAFSCRNAAFAGARARASARALPILFIEKDLGKISVDVTGQPAKAFANYATTAIARFMRDPAAIPGL